MCIAHIHTHTHTTNIDTSITAEKHMHIDRGTAMYTGTTGPFTQMSLAKAETKMQMQMRKHTGLRYRLIHRQAT